ncbi:DegV family protein [Bacillus sonorensis]|uniref:DegV domain-containing protein n=2 Tax=Bacillus sonorensis TaxID=119858 RepID=M5PA74_9BACI|nr:MULTISPECIES: DegV family protein [Bacillus]TWK82463.1 DegV domain-containing protein [Bacillus paralicheniformis]ASB88801.1 DegV domain-containing protein [Bacillus sonorensis]EME76389.1 DegV domain-containing protein [Bacillus sonorensis L12]MBG9915401.1 DegV domain-containing protein [Bacillus sonorensis]MCY8024434.1 DegV family protein [Bacillus sonorensis]
MTNIKIVTDSTADISDEEKRKYGISVLPLSIAIDGKVYRDQLDIQSEEFIVKMEAAAELPKSSQPPLGAFLELYEKLTEDGSEVISIHLSSELSGTFQTAVSASNMVGGKVTVIDSMYISKGLGFQVLRAAALAGQGWTSSAIIKDLEDIRNRTSLYVTIDSLENLIKGGRIGRGKALIGSLLKIKPIARLEDGIYTPEKNVRSTAQLIKYLTGQFLTSVKGKTVQAVGIAHADALDLAHKLKASLLEHIPGIDIDILCTTPIISTHTGRGAIGFSFYTD